MALVSKSKVLLLDEPMAGMGTQESESMVRLLSTLKGHYTMLLIEHDMDAVFALADRISVLVYGKIIATGTPERHPQQRRGAQGLSGRTLCFGLKRSRRATTRTRCCSARHSKCAKARSWR